MVRQTNTDTAVEKDEPIRTDAVSPDAKPFEYRPHLEQVCRWCGWKFVGYTCPGCATSP